MKQNTILKVNIKNAIVIISVVLLCIFGVFGKMLFNFIFIASNQYYSSAVECLEHRHGEEIISTIFEYESKKQGFYINQDKDGDLIISVLKIKRVGDKKYYHFKESSSAGAINNLVMHWYEMGDFEYFIAENEDAIIKYSEGKKPTYKEKIKYPTNGKEKTSVIYVIDKSL